MAEKIDFELVTPERLLMSEPVDMVVVPGTEGNFGALPGHAPFATTVRADVIEVYEGNTIRERIFVSGGFAEVTPERVTVLADEAINVDRLDRATVDQVIRSIEQDLADADSDAERERLATRLRIEQAKITALGRAGKA
jgi:F-type H+-transporting ATPase subunit epsilon